jgi:RHS repeat-associated protein
LPAGGSGGTTISAAPADGAPATARNLSLIFRRRQNKPHGHRVFGGVTGSLRICWPTSYNSVLAQPDQVIEADIGLSNTSPMNETLTATLTFNGVQQSPVYFSMSTITGNDPHVHLAQQVDVSAMPSGRYPWSLTVTSPDMASPATISGAVNVVNDSASPLGKGWDMPGLYRLFTNSVSGVPAGVLLSTGDGGAFYYTQGGGNSYSSPAGPHAFDTLTSVTGGGWKLVDPTGVTFNFNGSGYLTSRVERTGETTNYNWTGSDLTSILDAFGRTVPLIYSGGLLASIGDFAGSTWTIAHTGTNLTSITEPDPGGGSPVWQYGYTGNYMSSVEDPDANLSSFTLDSYHRLSQTALPGGATTSATSEQDFGYGSTNSSNPASLTMQTSVTPSNTDAAGNTSSDQKDQFGDIVSQVDAYGNLTTIQRDPNGLPQTVTQPPPAAGQAALVTAISHDTMGNETSATGAMPSYGTWTFNAFGEWATFTDSTGKEWTRSFDISGDVLTESDPLNNQVSWTYDTYGHPLTMTTPAPNNAVGTVTTQYFYDADERLIKILWPDGSTQLFGWNADDRQTSFTDENSHTTLANLDVLGRTVSVTNAAGGVTSETYDKNGNVLTTSDEMLDVTTNLWNARDELVQQTLPDPDGSGPLVSPVLAFTYSATGKELTETDGLGRTSARSYDKLDRLTTETLPDPDGSGPLVSPVITIGYDNDSRKMSQQTALGTTAWAYANADERLVTSVTSPDPDGSGPLTAPVAQTGYDADGRSVTSVDAMNHTITTTLNADGETTATTDNLNHTTPYVLGHLGELLTTADALSHSTSDEYDSRYRLIQTTAADGGITQITLDPAGNRVALVDPANNRTTWTLDQLNRPVTETNSSGTTTTAFDPSSEITSIQDADGRVRDFTHDNLHRLTAENWMSGTTIVAAMIYGYDAANQLVSASDANSAYAFGYDNDGNVLTTDNNGTPGVPDVLLASSYDTMGDRTSLGATIAGTADLLNSYTYDADQRLTMLQQQGQSGGNAVSSKEVDLAYNALGQFTTIADFNYLNGGPRLDIATGGYSYDTGNRLTGLAYTSNAGGNHIDAFGWGYDAANNVTSFSTNSGTATYGNDVTNQLTSASYTGTNQPANEAYSFDKNGNRTMSGYSTGSNNLITSDGTFNYQHDADGNQTVRTRISNTYATDHETTFAWDYRNRLTDVEYFDNNNVLTKHVHYVYGVFDHLLATEVDTTGSGSYNQIEHYVLDVSPEIPSAGVPGAALAQPLLQFNGNGAPTIRYLEALNEIFAEGDIASLTQGDVPDFILTDNLGTVRYVVDQSGTVIDKIDYNSFGQISNESNPAIHHFAGYTGGHIDPTTGSINDDHRWYDPATGRFLSEDPLGFLGGDTNLARYVGNEVTTLVDPTGLIPLNPALEEEKKKMLDAALAIQHSTALMALWTYQAMQQQAYGQLTGIQTAKQVIPSVMLTPQVQAAFQKKIADAMKKMVKLEAANQLKLLTETKNAAKKAYDDAIVQALQGNNAVQEQINKLDAQYKLMMLELAEAAAIANQPQ